MDGRCPDCTVKEKLKNLQVLRHVMAAREKGSGVIERKRCTVHDDKAKPEKSIDLREGQPESDCEA
jgi:hypothetical protein